MRSFYFLYLWMIYNMIVGCNSSDIEQQCRPEGQTGCDEGRFCALDVDGRSICLPLSMGQLSEGEICTQLPAENLEEGSICGPQLDCFQVGAVARCHRFCDPASVSPDLSCQSPLVGIETHPFAEYSTCNLRVVGREEIGGCDLPCIVGEFGASAGCPDGMACQLLPDADSASCLVPGNAPEGALCDLGCGCLEGLICVSDTRDFRCRSVANNAACGASYFQRVVPGTRDPINSDGDEWLPYEVCNRCVDLSVFGRTEEVWLCAQDSCEDIGALSRFPEGIPQGLEQAISTFVGGDFEVAVGLQKRGDEWYWSDGEIPIDVTEGADPVCAVFTDQQTLEARPACPDFSLCTPEHSAVCDFE